MGRLVGFVLSYAKGRGQSRVQSTEYGVLRAEYGVQSTENGGRRTDYGLRRTEGGVRSTEYRVRRTEDRLWLKWLSGWFLWISPFIFLLLAVVNQPADESPD